MSYSIDRHTYGGIAHVYAPRNHIGNQACPILTQQVYLVLGIVYGCFNVSSRLIEIAHDAVLLGKWRANQGYSQELIGI